MSNTHVVVGAGVVGSALAVLLAESGEQVTLISRSGTGPEHHNITKGAVDAADTARLLAVAPSACAIYNCANPPYDRWAKEWPPLAESFLAYAETTGAVLVTCSNLYGYGPVQVPMTENLPLNAEGTNGRVRADMWRDAKAMHDAGRIRATEVRGSDHLCAGAQSRVGTRVLPKVLKGKPAQVLGSLDHQHSWTYPLDVARLMHIVATDPKAWGKAWHVPSNAPKTQLELVQELARCAGINEVKLSSVPNIVWTVLALFNPVMKALRETAYQMDRSYILDDSLARKTFGMQPTDWNQILTDVVAETRMSSHN